MFTQTEKPLEKFHRTFINFIFDEPVLRHRPKWQVERCYYRLNPCGLSSMFLTFENFPKKFPPFLRIRPSLTYLRNQGWRKLIINSGIFSLYMKFIVPHLNIKIELRYTESIYLGMRKRESKKFYFLEHSSIGI